jgi:hypothetical protein
VLEIVSGHHLIADLTLGYGQVAYDYLAAETEFTQHFQRQLVAAD